jgi:hypothetical protein
MHDTAVVFAFLSLRWDSKWFGYAVSSFSKLALQSNLLLYEVTRLLNGAQPHPKDPSLIILTTLCNVNYVSTIEYRSPREERGLDVPFHIFRLLQHGYVSGDLQIYYSRGL